MGKTDKEKGHDMKNQLVTFLVGAVIGAVLGFGGIYLVGERYKVTSEALGTIKVDRWTGRSWMMRYYDNNGSKDFFWKPLEQK